MGPGGRVPNYGSSVIALRVLFPCRVIILRKDNLTWYIQDALSSRGVCFLVSILPWRPAFAQGLRKFVRKCVKRFAVHPGPDLALCIVVPEGHGLGEVRQLLGSNEGGS